MRKIRKIVNYELIIAILFVVILVSCSEYNKLLKSTDYEKKYNAAVAYYENKEYTKALALLEELISIYRGTNKAEKIMYYYAYSTYATGDYLLAGYHFNNFVRTFPTSDKVEECAFMHAYCYYLQSPRYSLDQTDTKNAIKELQLFLNKYPESSRKNDCNKLIAALREKLEKKHYEIAMQYYFLDDYKAAVWSFENLLKDYPDTKYREEGMFMIIKSNYLYASKSIEEKRAERLKSTIDAYNKFISFFPQQSKYIKEVEDYFLSAKKQLEKINKN